MCKSTTLPIGNIVCIAHCNWNETGFGNSPADMVPLRANLKILVRKAKSLLWTRQYNVRQTESQFQFFVTGWSHNKCLLAYVRWFCVDGNETQQQRWRWTEAKKIHTPEFRIIWIGCYRNTVIDVTFEWTWSIFSRKIVFNAFCTRRKSLNHIIRKTYPWLNKPNENETEIANLQFMLLSNSIINYFAIQNLIQYRWQQVI